MGIFEAKPFVALFSSRWKSLQFVVCTNNFVAKIISQDLGALLCF